MSRTKTYWAYKLDSEVLLSRDRSDSIRHGQQRKCHHSARDIGVVGDDWYEETRKIALPEGCIALEDSGVEILRACFQLVLQILDDLPCRLILECPALEDDILGRITTTDLGPFPGHQHLLDIFTWHIVF